MRKLQEKTKAQKTRVFFFYNENKDYKTKDSGLY